MAGLKKVVAASTGKIANETTNGEKLKKTLPKVTTEGMKWVFSFQFFKQIQYFGLDGDKVDNVWMLSVIERLQQLGTELIDDVLRDYAKAGAHRFHAINWSQKNIPVSMEDLDWISADYRDNPKEFPMMQFQISKAQGRIIGFFDEKNIFQLVLLDPLHNMQPSKDYGYVVDKCAPLGCEYTRLHDGIFTLVTKALKCECSLATDIAMVLKARGYQEQYSVLAMRVDSHQAIMNAENLISSGVAKCHAEIFELGIHVLLGDQQPSGQ